MPADRDLYEYDERDNCPLCCRSQVTCDCDYDDIADYYNALEDERDRYIRELEDDRERDRREADAWRMTLPEERV